MDSAPAGAALADALQGPDTGNCTRRLNDYSGRRPPSVPIFSQFFYSFFRKILLGHASELLNLCVYLMAPNTI